MASNSTATITVRIFVETEEKRVLYEEAGKDFVDVLLSFLTLPLGTIARLVDKDSNMKPLRLGCISSLYQSLANLEPKYWNSETCKQMLLKPRSSMERFNQRLKLNIDDTEPTKFYACEMLHCRTESHMLVSTFNNMKCYCGKNLNHVLDVDITISADKIEDFTVNIDPKEVMDLLKFSLVSNTVLTDSLLRRKQIIDNPKATTLISKVQDRGDKGMKLNLVIAKSKCKVLFAVVDEDFMDQLLSFLTVPLGSVERVLQGNSGLGCIDKLYNGLSAFDESTDFMSGKNMFNDLKLAPQYKLNKQMLPISDVIYPSPFCYRNVVDHDPPCYLSGHK
ncbi:hypothetical protein K1719_013130 [Acacia pycnantha]|nr:hypothetical protein K1719_013130 [Acacia pycnantha]